MSNIQPKCSSASRKPVMPDTQLQCWSRFEVFALPKSREDLFSHSHYGTYVLF